MSAVEIMDEPTTPTSSIAEDQSAERDEVTLDDLARCVVIHYLRRKEYWDRYDRFGHLLLLQMRARGIKSIDVGDYTIKVRPGTSRGHLSPSERKAARRWNFGAILNPNELPPRISVEKKRDVA